MELTPPSSPRHRFLFLSSNDSAWGGSEELWGRTACALAEDGHAVTAFKKNIDETASPVRRLRALSVGVHNLARLPLVPRALLELVTRFSYPVVLLVQIARLALGFIRTRPELVIVSQGGNLDGLLMMRLCRWLKKRYVVIAQKATEMYWPPDARVPLLRSVYQDAVSCYFVSEHNLRLTEDQLGTELPQASVVRNPFLVDWEPRQDWPEQSNGLRLACVGRLYPTEKGQDVLIRLLARDKWRNRPVSVTFYGSGMQRAALEAMCARLGITSVTFAGTVRDARTIWDDHHALILPTRCEGLPLVLVEAMLSGRVSIVTDVAGNAEVLTDNVTGFLAAAPTEDALDEALERAWQRRAEWRTIGAVAAHEIRLLVPADPARVMAAQLLQTVAQLGGDRVGLDAVAAPAET
jgi:glycosyltransferase involved in cell wall biosynthesis